MATPYTCLQKTKQPGCVCDSVLGNRNLRCIFTLLPQKDRDSFNPMYATGWGPLIHRDKIYQSAWALYYPAHSPALMLTSVPNTLFLGWFTVKYMYGVRSSIVCLTEKQTVGSSVPSNAFCALSGSSWFLSGWTRIESWKREVYS